MPGGTLPDGSAATYLIQESYGRRSGPNLFHSFSRFDIPVNAERGLHRRSRRSSA